MTRTRSLERTRSRQASSVHAPLKNEMLAGRALLVPGEP